MKMHILMLLLGLYGNTRAGDAVPAAEQNAAPATAQAATPNAARDATQELDPDVALARKILLALISSSKEDIRFVRDTLSSLSRTPLKACERWRRKIITKEKVSLPYTRDTIL